MWDAGCSACPGSLDVVISALVGEQARRATEHACMQACMLCVHACWEQAIAAVTVSGPHRAAGHRRGGDRCLLLDRNPTLA